MPVGKYVRTAAMRVATSVAMRSRHRENPGRYSRRHTLPTFQGRHHSLEARNKISRSVSRAIADTQNYSSKWEDAIFSRLSSLLVGAKIYRQHRISGCSHPFDFALVDQKILVEADGCWYHGCEFCRLPARFDQSSSVSARAFARSIGWTLFIIHECRASEDLKKLVEHLSWEERN